MLRQCQTTGPPSAPLRPRSACHCPVVTAPRAQRSRPRPCRAPQALQIDRRAAFDAAWRRQEAREAWLSSVSQDIQEGRMLAVRDATDLEDVLQLAGTQLVLVFLYSRTCGVCKDASTRFEQLRAESNRGRARVVFVRHDIETDYGDRSDLVRLHNVRAVPCFLFFDGGAVVRRLSLRDVRRLTGPKPFVQAALAEDVARLRRTFLEVLLSRAPSARS